MAGMILIGATVLSEFAAAHPGAGSDLSALAARLVQGASDGGWADAGALAADLGEGASAAAGEIVLAMPWCGARVRLAYDAKAEILAVREVAPLEADGEAKDR